MSEITEAIVDKAILALKLIGCGNSKRPAAENDTHSCVICVALLGRKTVLSSDLSLTKHNNHVHCLNPDFMCKVDKCYFFTSDSANEATHRAGHNGATNTDDVKCETCGYSHAAAGASHGHKSAVHFHKKACHGETPKRIYELVKDIKAFLGAKPFYKSPLYNAVLKKARETAAPPTGGAAPAPALVRRVIKMKRTPTAALTSLTLADKPEETKPEETKPEETKPEESTSDEEDEDEVDDVQDAHLSFIDEVMAKLESLKDHVYDQDYDQFEANTAAVIEMLKGIL